MSAPFFTKTNLADAEFKSEDFDGSPETELEGIGLRTEMSVDDALSLDLQELADDLSEADIYRLHGRKPPVGSE